MDYESLIHKKNFTLVEFLIVTSVIFMLISLINPSLKKIIDTANTTKCKVQVRAWSFVTNIYADDYNGSYMEDTFEQAAWIRLLRPYHEEEKADLYQYCPEAETISPRWVGSTDKAWSLGGTESSSYGINIWIQLTKNFKGWRNHPHDVERWQFGTVNRVNSPYRTPVFMDSSWWGVEPHYNINHPQGAPAPTRNWHEESWNWSYVMARITMDRHQKGINIGFADGSSRHVHLESLWNQQWVREGWQFQKHVTIPWL